MADNERNLYWHKHSVNAEERWNDYGYRSCVLWLTGLSAAGKSTIANVLSRRLHDIDVRNYVLDGDNIRHGLNKDLGFSHEDRRENIRRIGEVSKLLVDAGLLVMTAFISPYREDREQVRRLIDEGQFIEIYVKCPVSECEIRDPKGIYKKARAGAIKEFTGVSAPYEEPESPEIVLETDKLTVGECAEKVLEYLTVNGYTNFLVSAEKAIIVNGED
jgi:adenylylsulfate kinase